MKIHHKTKRGLNTLKFWACSEILTLILRGKLENPGIITLLYYSFLSISAKVFNFLVLTYVYVKCYER